MTIKNTFLGTLVATFLLSCTNDSTSDLLNIEPIGEQVSYATDVKSIIDNNCAVCHGTTPIPGTNLSLTNYEEVRNAVLNRGLINRILLEEGNSSLMPQGGPKLPQPIINIIIKWQEDGLQL
jgi:mono/diheme cytochrome c family protein